MGRFKRKNHQYAGSKNSSSSYGGRKSFSAKDRKVLIHYLQDYFKGAWHIYDNGPTATSSPLHDNSRSKHRSNSTEPIRIGGLEFPLLNKEALRHPYLTLPKELSSKQRRTVHELCINVGLFHIGVGPTRDSRVVAISIYRDGLSYIPNTENDNNNGDEHPSISFLQFQPWACRHHRQKTKRTKQDNNNSNHNNDDIAHHPKNDDDGAQSSSPTSLFSSAVVITERARQAIYQFVDQPGACLRDGEDSMDFVQMETEDLSDTTPPGFATGEWMLVDSAAKMRQCIQELEASKPTEIAFDLECFNKSNYTQLTCLIQLATNHGKEYVIDPLAQGVWESVHGLAPLFADPQIVKIGHSIGGLDVRCLHRDFGIFVVNAFDTYEAAQCLKLKSKGLAKVCAYYGLPDSQAYETLKAQYQTTDWTKRPLTKPMLEYGRYDVHYLLQLRRLMMRDLTRQELWESSSDRATKDAEARQVATSLAAMLRRFDEDEETFIEEDAAVDGPAALATPGEISTRSESIYEDARENIYEDANQEGPAEEGERKSIFEARELRMNLELMRVISRSQDRCLDLWTEAAEPPLKNQEFQTLMVRAKTGEVQEWTNSQLELYEALAVWRQDVADREECTAGFVCPLGLLATIAMKRPTTIIGLRQLSFHLPELFEERSSYDYAKDIFEMVTRSRQEDGLDSSEDFEIPSYYDFLERETTGRFLGSGTDDSTSGTRKWVAVGVVVGIVAVAAMVVTKSKRSR